VTLFEQREVLQILMVTVTVRIK